MKLKLISLLTVTILFSSFYGCKEGDKDLLALTTSPEDIQYVECFKDLKYSNITKESAYACLSLWKIFTTADQMEREELIKTLQIGLINSDVQKHLLTKDNLDLLKNITPREISHIKVGGGVYIKVGEATLKNENSPDMLNFSEFIFLLQSLSAIKDPHHFINQVYGINHEPFGSDFFGNKEGQENDAWRTVMKHATFLRKTNRFACAEGAAAYNTGNVSGQELNSIIHLFNKHYDIDAKRLHEITGLPETGLKPLANVNICHSNFKSLMGVSLSDLSILKQSTGQNSQLNFADYNLLWSEFFEQDSKEVNFVKRAKIVKMASTIIHEARHDQSFGHVECQQTNEELLALIANKPDLQSISRLVSKSKLYGTQGCDENLVSTHLVDSDFNFLSNDLNNSSSDSGSLNSPGAYSYSVGYLFFMYSNVGLIGSRRFDFNNERTLLTYYITDRLLHFNYLNNEPKKLFDEIYCYMGYGPTPCDTKFLHKTLMYRNDIKRPETNVVNPNLPLYMHNDTNNNIQRLPELENLIENLVVEYSNEIKSITDFLLDLPREYVIFNWKNVEKEVKKKLKDIKERMEKDLKQPRNFYDRTFSEYMDQIKIYQVQMMDGQITPAEFEKKVQDLIENFLRGR